MLPASLEWNHKTPFLKLLDQRFIPDRVEFRICRTFEDVADSIEDMTVRGAPLIGVAAAYGVALAAKHGKTEADMAIKRLAVTRPTAVNLVWALERVKTVVDSGIIDKDLFEAVAAEAVKIHDDDRLINRKLSFYGEKLLPDEAAVMTYCNAGALATSEYGTALGVFRAARESGKKLKIYACETRPRLQGARLTAFELLEDGFDVTVICDSMAAFLMSREKIDAVVTGADRIALNGDTANKIGTYGVAIAAKEHGVPFYIAAPISTIDIDCKCGADIPIEIRNENEIKKIGESYIMPQGVKVWNPSFDVTPSELISAIITEAGVIKKPFDESIIKITD